MHAISMGIPELGLVRYQLAIRRWFYLPLQYSKHKAHVALLRHEYSRMFWQCETLMHTVPGLEDTCVNFCRDVLIKEQRRLLEWKQTALLYFETQ